MHHLSKHLPDIVIHNPHFVSHGMFRVFVLLVPVEDADGALGPSVDEIIEDAKAFVTH